MSKYRVQRFPLREAHGFSCDDAVVVAMIVPPLGRYCARMMHFRPTKKCDGIVNITNPPGESGGSRQVS